MSNRIVGADGRPQGIPVQEVHRFACVQPAQDPADATERANAFLDAKSEGVVMRTGLSLTKVDELRGSWLLHYLELRVVTA